ncbi:mersacidin/lichenicidin family type 2 lantibiotic [Stigmatella sp. ncwal1]|uniref:Mersacidin/lichenicidin family type 2 lantibiotic n=1 Tax=Stigmatella ashevillensis TaxID=2995309 RepID=A0ABT5DMN7_9BACT|nr:mersacidin/lichenicidin family type 2 lantibiotic [Stigmatella ashevillena]MDC0714927.1 mersacidin/lichenicidin family type 2 lantibiotic [Stigmatella ashevillena]
MNPKNIIRAWKDPAFRASLSTEERGALPESPSGQPLSELSEDELLGITGGQIITSGDIRPSTGCIGPIRPTCGIIACPIIRDEVI